MMTSSQNLSRLRMFVDKDGITDENLAGIQQQQQHYNAEHKLSHYDKYSKEYAEDLFFHNEEIKPNRAPDFYVEVVLSPPGRSNVRSLTMTNGRTHVSDYYAHPKRSKVGRIGSLGCNSADSLPFGHLSTYGDPISKQKLPLNYSIYLAAPRNNSYTQNSATKYLYYIQRSDLYRAVQPPLYDPNREYETGDRCPAALGLPPVGSLSFVHIESAHGADPDRDPWPSIMSPDQASELLTVKDPHVEPRTRLAVWLLKGSDMVEYLESMSIKNVEINVYESHKSYVSWVLSVLRTQSHIHPDVLGHIEELSSDSVRGYAIEKDALLPGQEALSYYADMAMVDSFSLDTLLLDSYSNGVDIHAMIHHVTAVRGKKNLDERINNLCRVYANHAVRQLCLYRSMIQICRIEGLEYIRQLAAAVKEWQAIVKASDSDNMPDPATYRRFGAAFDKLSKNVRLSNYKDVIDLWEPLAMRSLKLGMALPDFLRHYVRCESGVEATFSRYLTDAWATAAALMFMREVQGLDPEESALTTKEKRFGHTQAYRRDRLLNGLKAFLLMLSLSTYRAGTRVNVSEAVANIMQPDHEAALIYIQTWIRSFHEENP